MLQFVTGLVLLSCILFCTAAPVDDEKSGYSTGFDVVGRLEISNVASAPIESGYWQAHNGYGNNVQNDGYSNNGYHQQGYGNSGTQYGGGYGGNVGYGGGGGGYADKGWQGGYGNAIPIYQQYQPSSYSSGQGYQNKGKPSKHRDGYSNKHNDGYDDDDDDDGYDDDDDDHDDVGYDDDNKGHKNDYKPRKNRRHKKPVIKPKVIIVKKLIPLSTTTTTPV